MSFEIKDSGVRESFGTGSVRDTEDGKGRYDLIPRSAVHRLAQHYQNGAKKYGDRNWERGQSMRRVISSTLRHGFQYLDGDRDEDHLAAMAWGTFVLIHHEEAIKKGQLPSTLADLPWMRPYEFNPFPSPLDKAAESIRRLSKTVTASPVDNSDKTPYQVYQETHGPLKEERVLDVKSGRFVPIEEHRDRQLLLYVAGPYRDPRGTYYVEQNIQKAAEVGRQLWNWGYSVIVPHLNTRHLDDGTNTAEVFLKGDKTQISRCDAVVFLPEWTKSEGSQEEHEFSCFNHIPRVFWWVSYTKEIFQKDLAESIRREIRSV